MYEGGTREPLLVRWPKVVQPGTVCAEPVTTPDFYPTLLEAANLPLRPSQHCDGTSFLPLLRREAFEREPLFWHYPHYSNQGGRPGCSIRVGDHKLIEFYEDGKLELYNLREDLGEDDDLAPDSPSLRDELHERLVAWRTQVGAVLPDRNPDWQSS
jgi:arylsulfatase A-like enzyme